MTSAPIVQPRTSTEEIRDSWRRLTAWSGIAFAPLFVVGFLFVNDTPDTTASNAKWISWYANGGNRHGVIVGLFLMVIAGLCFMAFAAGAQEWLRRASDRVPVAYRLLSASGMIAATLFILGGIVTGAMAGNISIGGQPVPHDADILRQNIGYPIVAVAGAITAAVFIAAVTAAARGTQQFPTWLVWLGWVAAVVVLFGAVFVPMVALPIWVLAVSIVRLRQSDSA